MEHDADIIIVGAGLAGACAALTLSSNYNVLVVEAKTPASGASGAAAGLVNPFMGRRARPVWRLRDALDAVSDLLARAGVPELFPPRGVLRPVVESDQEEPFRKAADNHPQLATWLSAAQVRQRFPDVRTDLGALYVPAGGAIEVPSMVEALLEAAVERGATVQTGAPVIYWREAPGEAAVEVDRGSDTEEIRADRVVLALGQGYPSFPELRRLGLDGVKGQTVRVPRPAHLTDSLIPLSGRGYVVPQGEDTLILGSNYSNDFDDLAPDPEATTYIRKKTARMVDGVDEVGVLEEKAGVRVKHTKSNLPLLGPLPRRQRIWTFTALGSKGLLTAPMLAQELPRYLENPDDIPSEVRPPDS